MTNVYTPELVGNVGNNRRIRGVGTYVVTDNGGSTMSIAASTLGQIYNAAQYEMWVKVQIGSRGAVEAGPFSNQSSPGANWMDVGGAAYDIVTITKQTYPQYVAIVFTVRSTSSHFPNPATATATVTVPAYITKPSAPTSVTNSRVSDNRNDVSWVNNPSTYGIYSSLRLQRSVNGGAFADLAGAAGLPGSATSYADTTTAANHRYAYLVVAVNSSGSTASVASSTTYNTPSTPYGLSASRVDATTVKVDFENPATTATSINRQRSSDGSSWANLTAVSNGTAVSTTDVPGGGTFYYRLQAARGTLLSDWSQPSNAVVTITPPAAPTLVAPVSGAVVSLASNTLGFAWQHNALDGSNQTAAQLRLSLNGGSTWSETLQVTGSEMSVSRAVNWPVNTTVTWQVRSKGAHADYGPWSSSRSFNVIQVPQVAITQPTSGLVLTTMPLYIAWQYSDMSGSQQSALLTISNDSGRMVWQRSLAGTASSYTLEASELLLSNKTTFSLEVSVASTSTLSAQTSTGFKSDYVEPAEPTLIVSTDERFSAVQAILIAGTPTGMQPPTVSLGLFRRHPEGTLVSLGSGYQDGTVVVDHYAPTDTALEYIAVAATAAGVTSQTVQTTLLKSYGAAVWNYADSYRLVAKLTCDPKSSRSREHDRTVFHTAGSEDPLVFYGQNTTLKGSRSGTVLPDKGIWPNEHDPSALSDLEALSLHKGDVVMRLPGERAFMADLTVAFDASSDLSGVSVAWQKVRGHDGLAL